MIHTDQNRLMNSRTDDFTNGTDVQTFENQGRAESEQEVIASVAYELWARRNGQNGSALDDWLEAETIVRSREEVDTRLAA